MTYLGQDIPKVSDVAKSLVGMQVGEGPIKFELQDGVCKQLDHEPIRKLEDFRLEFKGAGWKEVCLFGFEPAAEWPDWEPAWKPHGGPNELKWFIECEESGGKFVFPPTALPKKLADDLLPKQLVNEILLLKGTYVIVKFNVLAKRSGTGEWLFVDPGTGIKP